MNELLDYIKTGSKYQSIQLSESGKTYKIYKHKDNFDKLLALTEESFIKQGMCKKGSLYFLPKEVDIKSQSDCVDINIDGTVKIRDIVYSIYAKLKTLEKIIVDAKRLYEYCDVFKAEGNVHEHCMKLQDAYKKYPLFGDWIYNNSEVEVAMHPSYLSLGCILNDSKQEFTLNAECFDFYMINLNIAGILDLSNTTTGSPKVKGLSILRDGHISLLEPDKQIPLFIQMLMYQHNQKYNIIDQYDTDQLPSLNLSGNLLESRDLLFIVYKYAGKNCITHTYVG